MTRTPQELREIMVAYDATEKLLNELAGLGFQYKRITSITLEPQPSFNQGQAGWWRWDDNDDTIGQVGIYPGAYPGTIIHEMAHGFAERLQKDHALPEFVRHKYGEHYCEAIRWFVETRLGWTQWKDDFRSRSVKEDLILELCNYSWDQFKCNLKSGLFYPHS